MLVLFPVRQAQLVQQAPVLPLKALLLRSTICQSLAIIQVIRMSFLQTGICMHGMALLGLMLAKLLARQAPLV
jgi:O-succinylbenzoate synthase